MNKTLAGIATIGILGGGAIDATQLSVAPVQAEFQLKERVNVKQVGDVVEATMPWKGEPGLKVKYDMGTPSAKEKLLDKRERQAIVEQVGSDAMKIDIILNEKPTTNRFCYTIEGHENYDFFHQPALTPEEIADGAIRPEEIVGSYAVYHKTLKNHKEGGVNYETGKATHIPYPYVWEVGNEEATKQRADDLTWDEETGQLCVDATTFLESPERDWGNIQVRIDPTFGYTSAGGTEKVAWGFAYATLNSTYQYDASSGDTITSYSFYVKQYTTPGTLYGASYSVVAGTVTSRLAAATSWALSVGGPSWSTSGAVSQAMSAGTRYTVAGAADSDNTSVYYDTGGAGESGDSNDGYSAGLTATWSQFSTYTRRVSMYVTYTTAGGGTPLPEAQSTLQVSAPIQISGGQVIVR